MRRTGFFSMATGIALLIATLSPAAASGPLAQETIDKIHDFASSSFDELGIPGAAVLVVDGDGIVYEEGFGTADDADTPVTATTPFHLASLSKQLTGIAVMQLIESGDLELDATVHSYLPWFGDDGSDTAKITIGDLLAHASGFSEGDGLTNRSDEGTDDGALERNIRRLADVPLSHAIGQFEYSNANYDALGYLVAVTSGMSYEAYMAERVFAPLGMVDTFTSEADARAGGVAQGHYPFFGFPIAFPVGFVRGSVPSAFIASSAEDLGRVLMAHLNDGVAGDGQILSTEGMRQLRQPLIHPNPWDGYGWGWWSYPLWDAGQLVDSPDGSSYEVPVILEHGGSHSTYATGMILLPDAGYGVVVLMNGNDEAAPSRFYQIHNGIAQILVGRDAAALINYDDPLGLYGRQLLGATALLMIVGVWWALRQLRRWRRDPASAPRGRRGMLRHLVLPLALDVGLTVLAWWLVLTRSNLGPGDYPAILRLAPDIGLAIGLIAVFGLVWGLVRTALTLRVLRASNA
ncbi:MAG: beta-lactamase family protein [Chloroflexota bacterium]|nr:beta-lactamase family protein [Chloroflexota bacterium]